MSSRVVDVPAEVRDKAAAQGVEGLRWLQRLGEVIDGLERDWGVVVGSPLRGGSDSYVAEATTSDGRQAVVKLARSGAGHEIESLRLADGRGYVRLLESDEARQAMLQERLGPSLASLGLPVRSQVEIVCATLRRAWGVSPEASFPSGAEKAVWLADFIAATWQTLDRPCSERVVERALSFAEARRAAFDPDDAVLVHGDAHSANTLLASAQEPSRGARFKLVDPDGLFAERACDLAVPMREWSRELLEGDTVVDGRERCGLLSRLTGVDPQPIWEWGFMERVSTGLLALQVGRRQLGRDMLAVAEAFALP